MKVVVIRIMVVDTELLLDRLILIGTIMIIF